MQRSTSKRDAIQKVILTSGIDISGRVADAWVASVAGAMRTSPGYVKTQLADLRRQSGVGRTAPAEESEGGSPRQFVAAGAEGGLENAATPSVHHAKGSDEMPAVATRHYQPGEVMELNGSLAARKAWSEIVNVTPEMAERWLIEWFFDGQRKLRQWHAEELVEAVRRGEFALTTIRVWHYQGRAYITDGQHRLRAVVLSGISVPFNVLHQTAISREEIEADYWRTDSGILRNLKDAIDASSEMLALGLTNMQKSAIGAATRVIAAGFEKPPHSHHFAMRSRDVRLRAIKQWSEEGKAFFGLVGSSSETLQKPLYRSAILSVALTTLRYRQEEAIHFWRIVIENDGLRRNTPEWKLVDFLHRPAGKCPNVREHCRRVAACWNAHLDGRPLQKLYVISENAPILIKGTPYDGKRVIREDFADL